MSGYEMKLLNKNYENKEYSDLIDFIALYINMQEALIDKISIAVVDKKYIILDKNKNVLFSLIEYDDTLLDVVVTLAPKKIEIYNILNFKNRELIKTIINIFKERVEIYNDDIRIKS